VSAREIYSQQNLPLALDQQQLKLPLALYPFLLANMATMLNYKSLIKKLEIDLEKKVKTMASFFFSRNLFRCSRLK
jgi:hypothetical protein